MADNQKGIPFGNEDEGISFPEIAKRLVFEHAKPLVKEEFPEFSPSDVYVVWFCYILGGWKALCSTAVADGRYYEVTYAKDRHMAFVDIYAKTHNIEVYVPA